MLATELAHLMRRFRLREQTASLSGGALAAAGGPLPQLQAISPQHSGVAPDFR